jgi:hypothetical protein
MTETNGARFINNYFHDWHIAVGDHPDAIQFWTDNVTRCSNITVSGNVIMRGAGDKSQGVFFDDLNAQGMRDFHITGNFLAGTGFNGIFPAGSASAKATGIVISDNELWSSDSGDNQTWIRLADTVGAVVTNNKANAFLLTERNASLTDSGNVIVGVVADGGAAALAAWLVTHPEMAWILTV